MNTIKARDALNESLNEAASSNWRIHLGPKSRGHLFAGAMAVFLSACSVTPTYNPYNSITLYQNNPCGPTAAHAATSTTAASVGLPAAPPAGASSSGGTPRPAWCEKSQDKILTELAGANMRADQRMRPGEDCTDHALYAWDEAKKLGYDLTKNIYTCPFGTREECHTALVVQVNNMAYVMDNGYVFRNSFGTNHVGTLKEFNEMLNYKTVIAGDPWTATDLLRQYVDR